MSYYTEPLTPIEWAMSCGILFYGLFAAWCCVVSAILADGIRDTDTLRQESEPDRLVHHRSISDHESGEFAESAADDCWDTWLDLGGEC